VDAHESFNEVKKAAVTTLDAAENRELLRIHAEKGKEVLPRILEFLVRKQIAVIKVSSIQPTLEDVFIAQTGRSLRD